MLEEELADELRAIEEARLRSLVECDLVVAERLHADDYQLITPGGAALSKADYLGAIGSGDLVYRRFEMASVAQVLAGGAETLAVLRYRAAIEVEFRGGASSETCWHTDCYRNSPAGWQAVWSQATAILAD